jgi:head-tail adaptor
MSSPEYLRRSEASVHIKYHAKITASSRIDVNSTKIEELPPEPGMILPMM